MLLILLKPDVFYRYPARDARIDDDLGAKRIEWIRGQKVKSAMLSEGNAWNPITNVDSAAITCKRTHHVLFEVLKTKGGRSPLPPQLHAVARAGSNVTIQWSGT